MEGKIVPERHKRKQKNPDLKLKVSVFIKYKNFNTPFNCNSLNFTILLNNNENN
jgi:hypothetical protein